MCHEASELVLGGGQWSLHHQCLKQFKGFKIKKYITPLMICCLRSFVTVFTVQTLINCQAQVQVPGQVPGQVQFKTQRSGTRIYTKLGLVATHPPNFYCQAQVQVRSRGCKD